VTETETIDNFENEYTDAALLALALSRTGDFADQPGSIVATVEESVISGGQPWAGGLYPYPQFSARRGRYRLETGIPPYDGIGRYEFRWRVRGGGLDEDRSEVVIPEPGATTVSTPVYDVAPGGVGEARLEDAVAVWYPV